VVVVRRFLPRLVRRLLGRPLGGIIDQLWGAA
jgi:hypothetical protein